MGGAETLLYPSSTVQGWELLTMGYTQETTLQMTLLAKEKITKPKSASVPVYKVTLVREGRVSCYQQQIRSSADASTLLHTYLADVDREHFVIIFLTQKNRIIGVSTVSIGSLTASIVHHLWAQPPQWRVSAKSRG
jgi:DNA repair protein RadC